MKIIGAMNSYLVATVMLVLLAIVLVGGFLILSGWGMVWAGIVFGISSIWIPVITFFSLVLIVVWSHF